MGRAKIKLREAAGQILGRVQMALRSSEVKQSGKEQIQVRAREFITDQLARTKIKADRDNHERWERERLLFPKRKDMEL